MQIELLTQDDAARLLRRQRRTLEDWRYRGFGPRDVMVGRYRVPDEALSDPAQVVERAVAWLQTGT